MPVANPHFFNIFPGQIEQASPCKYKLPFSKPFFEKMAAYQMVFNFIITFLQPNYTTRAALRTTFFTVRAF